MRYLAGLIFRIYTRAWWTSFLVVFRVAFLSQFELPMKKADLKLLLEDYAGQLSPESIGPMERGRAAMLIARVLKLLVELELKRLS